MTLKRFSRDALPDESLFSDFRKVTITKAARIDGPFEVVTREGIAQCKDGWIALDEDGFPYPIAAKAFDKQYEPIGF